MSRLDDAEERLNSAIMRLEKAIAVRAKSEKARLVMEQGLRGRVFEVEAERNAMEDRLNSAAVKLDATIEQLQKALQD